MLRFRDFLLERVDFDEPRYGYSHETKVGDNKVTTHFVRQKNPNRYHVGFKVNDSSNKRAGSTGHAHVLTHVHHVVHEFVKKHKPHSIIMQATDADPVTREKKSKLYSHYARELADKHGGEYKKVPTDHIEREFHGAALHQHEVHFPH